MIEDHDPLFKSLGEAQTLWGKRCVWLFELPFDCACGSAQDGVETQRTEAGTEVESTGSVVQEVGRKCGGRRKIKVRQVNKKSDVVSISDFLL